MRTILIIYFFLVVIAGCRERQIRIADIPIENIDFFSLKQKGIDDIPDECIHNIKYINLDTDNADLLFSRIDKIKLWNHRIYILDSYQKMLGVFDSLEHGIGKVGNVGRAPAEYLNADDFSIDTKGRITVLDGRLDKINTYDKDFNFINSVKLSFEVDVFQSLCDGNYLLGLSSWNEGPNANDKIIKADSSLNPLNVYCQYEKDIDDNYWISNYHFLSMDKYIIYNRFLDNHVYLFSKNGKPLQDICFDFGKKNVPESAKKNIEDFEGMFDRFCCLKNFTIVGEEYLLGYVWDERTDKIFLIDKSAGILYLGKTDPFNKLGSVIGVCDEGIISCIYPGEYLEHKKEVDLPEDVRQHLNHEGVVLRLFSFVNRIKV